MNRCHFKEELSAYLDEQLSAQKKAEMEKHLAGCRGCREELSRLKQLSEQLKAWQAPDLGPDFDNSVRNRIVLGELEKGEVKMDKKTTSVWIPSGAIVTLLLLVIVTGQFYFKRGLQGRLKGAADDKVEVFDPAVYAKMGISNGISDATRRLAGSTLTFSGEQYEPNYAEDKEMSNSFSAGNEKMAAWDKNSNGYNASTATVQQPSGEGQLIVIQPSLPATAEGEKVIRNAQLMLQVVDGREAYKRASEICQELGGYLASSKFYKDNEGREAGTIVMRIPKDKFLTAQDRLSNLGKVENITTDSRDVTLEYNNLKTQLGTAKIVYDKMMEALQKRQVTIPEAMRLESELTPIRSRIEVLKGQIERLENEVSFTTVTLSFHEPKVSEKTLKESQNVIKESMIIARINSIKFLANAIPTMILIAFWVVISLVVFLLVKPLIVKLFKKG